MSRALTRPEAISEAPLPRRGGVPSSSSPRGRPPSDSARVHPLDGPLSPPGGRAARLGSVADRFSAFYNDLEAEKQHRREAEAQRRAALAESVAKLERGLDSEIKRRAEADKSIQMTVETELKSLSERVANQMHEYQAQIKASLDSALRTLGELQLGLREEREARRADVEHLAQSLACRAEEMAAALDDERCARLEREAQTLKRVGEDLFHTQERLDAERLARETAVESLHTDIKEGITFRKDLQNDFHEQILMGIADLKKQVNAEREERMSEDEQIVQAISDYTRALQDGLRIVNSG